MDGARFDAFARALTNRLSRRGVAQLVGLVTLTTLAGDGAAAVTPGCPALRQRCNGRCVNLQSSRGHCGACNHRCPAGTDCKQGRCAGRGAGCGAKGCRVFVSSTTHHTGDLGGLAGADAICQRLARRADLPGKYRAWLSSTTASPSTRFRRRGRSRYVLVDLKTVVAQNWNDLTSGTIRAAINRDETGDRGVSGLVWTGTSATGEAVALTPAESCLNWRDASDQNTAEAGSAGLTGPEWSTQGFGFPCDTRARLYCFQQDRG